MHPYLVAAVVAASLLCGCTVLGVGVRVDDDTLVDPASPIVVTDAGIELRGAGRDDVARTVELADEPLAIDTHTTRRVAAAAIPAVASIFTATNQPLRVSLFPIPLPGTYFRVPIPGKGLGSGFFVHPDGCLLTNAHVVARASRIRAQTSSGRSLDLAVIARDPALDLALLKADAEAPLPFLALATGATAAVGDRVVAIGSPLGLGHTVTEGIVSQSGRQLAERSETPGRYIEFLQIDAALNPGSSGGPLLTLRGEVVGVNTAAARGADGIAFTIPSHQVIAFVEAVLSGHGVVPGDPQPQAPRADPRRPLGQ